MQALVLQQEAGVGTAGDGVMESSATYVEMPIRWPDGEGVGPMTWIQESVVSRVFRGPDVTPSVRVWLTTAWAEGTVHISQSRVRIDRDDAWKVLSPEPGRERAQDLLAGIVQYC